MSEAKSPTSIKNLNCRQLAFNHDHVDNVAQVIATQLGMQVSTLAYPEWSKELAAGDYSDILALSGLQWLLCGADADVETRKGA